MDTLDQDISTVERLIRRYNDVRGTLGTDQQPAGVDDKLDEKEREMMAIGRRYGTNKLGEDLLNHLESQRVGV